MMKVRKRELAVQTKLTVFSPPEGFDEGFLDALASICAGDGMLLKAYLVLTENEGSTVFFFAFLFDKEMPNSDVGPHIHALMSSILGVFAEEVSVDAVCLNNQRGLEATVESITTPFFHRRSDK